jgi:dihydrofolate reductase
VTEPAARPTPAVVAIAAVCANGVIGDGTDQPWTDRDDFARFKRLTLGHVLVMGRRTFEAIGRPLPGRHTVVLTRTVDWSAAGVAVAADLDTAFALAARAWPDATVFVAGGGQVYREALPRTTRLELTEVDQDCPGTVTFPAVDPAQWRETDRERRTGFSWVGYDRVRPPG